MVKYRPFFASRFLKIVVPERNIYKVSIDDESLMASLLTIAPVDQLQSEIASSVRERTTPGIYVSLNKSHKGSETFLKKAKVNTQQLFFIDCVTTEKKEEGAIHVSPDDLEILKSTIYSFVDQIKGRHFLVIDALSTLLIYNNENSHRQRPRRNRIEV